MTAEFTNFNHVLDQLYQIDLTIESLLEEEDYVEVILNMSKRLTLISQITKIVSKEKPSDKMKLQLSNLFDSASTLQNKVKIKMEKISERLKERRKVKTQNKKIAYY
jgi:hypothetical protein